MALDEAGFRSQLAGLDARGLFVASPGRPPPVGTALDVQFDLDGGHRATGTGKVLAHASQGGHRGYYLAVADLQVSSAVSIGVPLEIGTVPVRTGARRRTSSEAVPVLTPAQGVPAQPLAGPGELESAGSTSLILQVAEVIEIGKSKGWAGGLLPFDKIGAYRLLDRLGRGGMAEVFLAHAELGDGVEKLVALKMALPEYGPETEFGALFLNEARVSATLEHPNLVQVFDAGEFAGRPYLAMEYLQGWSVSQLLDALRARRQMPPLGLGVHVAIELCKALEYVHDKRDLEGHPQGLVHRDVSGANVFVTDRGEVKLLDFGAAAANTFAESSRLLVGKPGYMPPEQLAGAAPTPSWDVFSLGVVLHEMLTLEPRRGRIGPPVQPAQLVFGIDPELDRLVRLSTSLDPAQRPTPRDLRAQLEQVRTRLPRCDLAALGWEVGWDPLKKRLESQRSRVETLVSEARRRMRPRRHSRGGLRPLRNLRRRVVATRTWIWLAGHVRLVRVMLAALALGAVAAGVLGARWWYLESTFRDQLLEADKHLLAGRLAGPGRANALGVLLAAQELRPGDARVRERLRALADAFEALSVLAESRASPAEAAVFLEGAVRADPTRPHLREHLQELERQVRQPKRRPR